MKSTRSRAKEARPNVEGAEKPKASSGKAKDETSSTSSTTSTSAPTNSRATKDKLTTTTTSSHRVRDPAPIGVSSRTKGNKTPTTVNQVIGSHNLPQSSSGASHERRSMRPSPTPSPSSAKIVNKQQLKGSSNNSSSSVLVNNKKRHQVFKQKSRDTGEDTSSSSQEMTTTNASTSRSDATLTPFQGGNIVVEQETSLASRVGAGDTDDDDECMTLLDSPVKLGSQVTSNQQATGASVSPLVLYHDDEEIINQTQGPSNAKLLSVARRRISSDDDYEEDEFNEFSNGAALTMADDDQITTIHSEEVSFVVYPLGCCEFDETQLVSATSTRAIQKCILRLANKPTPEESTCWGLDQSQPILMRLLEDHIQFTDISTQTLLRSQPIVMIKSWAVDDDNTFAFVIEENIHHHQQQLHQQQPLADESTLDYALLNGPAYVCYVFRSMDDDDMSCRVAAKLNEEITKYREQLASRVSKSTKLQQMIVVDPKVTKTSLLNQQQQQVDDQTDLDVEDIDDELDELATSNELSMDVKYIGKVQVPRPMGIDVLNVAIDKCLAQASKCQMDRLLLASDGENESIAITNDSGLTDAQLHVSPSSVIVENTQTGEIIVECRIRYLTFMGISRRDIRWCGFIMQNTTTKTFEAHCIECQPTAGHVCEAIQVSCSKMYEKMVKGQQRNKSRQQDSVTSIMPNSSKIRDTLAKTLSRIKLTPII